MRNPGILLAGCDAEQTQMVREATRVMFPEARIASAKTTTEALAGSADMKMELLVLAHPNSGEVAKAREMTDAEGLPRWAIVVLGADAVSYEGVEALAPEEWSGPALPRALRSALAQHALRRELRRARGDLLAIGSRVTHDLCTEVAGILATSELLREILSDEQPSRAELTDPIFASVDGLGKIIERLSFLAKASATGPVKRSMDMGDAIFRALQRLDPLIQEKGVALVVPAAWPEVDGDMAWLEKIWINLVANALAHAGERPQIELGWTEESGEPRFWIRDNGRGVADEKRSQLFQPFHLMHRPNSPRGLGLTIVQRLVELHGGRCGYRPREGGGAEFSFTLSTAKNERSRSLAEPVVR